MKDRLLGFGGAAAAGVFAISGCSNGFEAPSTSEIAEQGSRANIETSYKNKAWKTVIGQAINTSGRYAHGATCYSDGEPRLEINNAVVFDYASYMGATRPTNVACENNNGDEKFLERRELEVGRTYERLILGTDYEVTIYPNPESNQ